MTDCLPTAETGEDLLAHMIFPTDNIFDIPVLRTDRQASVVAPVIPWGSIARTLAMGGTWVFYVDDGRFARVLRDPHALLRTDCACAVEPNITLYDNAPRAEVVWATYRKRYAARVWQEAGIPVFADLCVPTRHLDDNGVGLPADWWAFATRAFAGRIEELQAEWSWAHNRAAGRLLLLVYGGGQPAQNLCRTLEGAVWVPGFRGRHG